MSYYSINQNTDTNDTDIHESIDDASQSQTVDCMFDKSPPVGELNIKYI